MNLDEYQEFTRTTAIYPKEMGLIYCGIGLGGEAGEFLNKLKKTIRDGKEAREVLVSELGDVLWYVARCADELGVSLSAVAALNVSNLTSRKERGVLGGSGDSR